MLVTPSFNKIQISMKLWVRLLYSNLNIVGKLCAINFNKLKECTKLFVLFYCYFNRESPPLHIWAISNWSLQVGNVFLLWKFCSRVHVDFWDVTLLMIFWYRAWPIWVCQQGVKRVKENLLWNKILRVERHYHPGGLSLKEMVVPTEQRLGMSSYADNWASITKLN